MGIYALRHQGALTARYEATTIARDGLSGLPLVLQAVGNWLRDIDPWHWATAGDPAPYIHNAGYGAFFLGIMARPPRRRARRDAPAGVLEQPLVRGETIYVDFDDRGAQTQARWHAVAAGLPLDRVVVLPDGGIPPVGSTVFARFQGCDYVCEELDHWEEYSLARAVGPRATP